MALGVSRNAQSNQLRVQLQVGDGAPGDQPGGERVVAAAFAGLGAGLPAVLIGALDHLAEGGPRHADVARPGEHQPAVLRHQVDVVQHGDGQG